ncbi:MAG: RNA methyltransferase [Pseudomonadota bacterium]
MQNKVRVDIALVHYPVSNRNGEIIASAVTNLDIHDLARLARTYGLGAFHIVTPIEEQQSFVREILDHWLFGWGRSYNQDRVDALELVEISPSIEAAEEKIENSCGKRPLLITTSARTNGNVLSIEAARDLLRGRSPVLLAFGTAWGLANKTVERADYVLPPIEGRAGYNHLSVRTAAAIIIDRLLGACRT